MRQLSLSDSGPLDNGKIESIYTFGGSRKVFLLNVLMRDCTDLILFKIHLTFMFRFFKNAALLIINNNLLNKFI